MTQEPSGPARELSAGMQDERRRAAGLAARSHELGEALKDTAAHIADTEDKIADTLEQLAEERPEAAERLRRKARAAREVSARERARSDGP